MRLTRDFSGKPARGGVSPGGGFSERGRAPAHARKIRELRESGQRIGLLLVAVDDWEGGWEFVSQDAVQRVVVPPELDASQVDLSVAVALDCLICGTDDASRLSAVAVELFRVGAASVWGEFASGLWCMEFWPHGMPWYVCTTGPVPTGRFGRALKFHRDLSLMLGEGLYAAPMFQEARAAALYERGLLPDLTLAPNWPPRAWAVAEEIAAAQADLEEALGQCSSARGPEAYAAARAMESAARERLRALENENNNEGAAG